MKFWQRAGYLERNGLTPKPSPTLWWRYQCSVVDPQQRVGRGLQCGCKGAPRDPSEPFGALEVNVSHGHDGLSGSARPPDSPAAETRRGRHGRALVTDALNHRAWRPSGRLASGRVEGRALTRSAHQVHGQPRHAVDRSDQMTCRLGKSTAIVPRCTRRLNQEAPGRDSPFSFTSRPLFFVVVAAEPDQTTLFSFCCRGPAAR